MHHTGSQNRVYISKSMCLGVLYSGACLGLNFPIRHIVVTMRALPGRLAAAGVARARVVRRRPRLPALHRVPELDHATLLLFIEL